ncbi:calcium-binding protein [Alteromonas aestuariivivens]|uniref:Calcium-binding protein n=1 Tax=Alteromonas aestuariivivens TaxID=1938339 RepID=A0A3D8M9Q8_9ALTE|nr:excalibur calcium-binding domain-containing protein [Alteromonas aestuariivivens]RDV26783.1 calcium-binding protein [Alteromonas aestuariivivens]
MKKHLFVILTALIINYFTQAPVSNEPIVTLDTFDASSAYLSGSGASSKNFGRVFRCDERQYCSQMTSREEAEFFLQNCPNTKLDGDNDGIPCEKDLRW